MNLVNSDILELIVSKMDDRGIKSLSLVPGMWVQMSKFISQETFFSPCSRSIALVSQNRIHLSKRTSIQFCQNILEGSISNSGSIWMVVS